MTQWTRVGLADPCTLTTERTVLHHAIQLLAAFGQTLVEPRPDDSHRSARWDPSTRAFRTDATDEGLEAGISLVPFRLELWRSGHPQAGTALDDLTSEDGLAWLRSAVHEEIGDPAPDFTLPDWDLPPRDADGETFRVSEEAREEFARWYDNAHRLLTEVANRTAGASEVRCWPHHFDIATLVTYPVDDAARQGDDGEPRYIGIGLSPGDADYPQPYLYVNAWPAPDSDALPPLVRGS